MKTLYRKTGEKQKPNIRICRRIRNAAFLFLLTCTITCGFSQNVLLEEFVEDSLMQQNGPNLKNFTYTFLGYGFILGPTEGTGGTIKYGSSSSFSTGLRYKRKLNEWYALGVGVAYHLVSFHLRQNEKKVLPNKTLHDQERLSFNNLEAEVYNRFNFSRRGNILGKYLDLGGYVHWGFAVRHHYRDKLEGNNEEHARIKRVKNTGLHYIQPFNYGAVARIGINRFTLIGRYRLSDLFKPQFEFPELPRYNVGVEIAIYN